MWKKLKDISDTYFKWIKIMKTRKKTLYYMNIKCVIRNIGLTVNKS